MGDFSEFVTEYTSHCFSSKLVSLNTRVVFIIKVISQDYVSNLPN